MADKDRRIDAPGEQDAFKQALAAEPVAPPIKGSGNDLTDLQQRRIRALQMHNAGMTWAQIAAALGYNDDTAARKAVMRGLDRVLAAEAEEHRSLSFYRITEMRRQLMPYLLAPTDPADARYVEPGVKIAAFNSLLRAEERLAKLGGLDAPTRLQISGELREETERAISELRAALLGEDGAWEVTDVDPSGGRDTGEAGVGR